MNFPLSLLVPLVGLRAERLKLGDNSVQNFHFGRCIIGYAVRNLFEQWSASRAVIRDFWPYIFRYTWQYTSPNENFELLQFPLKFKAACHPTKRDVINDVKRFMTIRRRVTKSSALESVIEAFWVILVCCYVLLLFHHYIKLDGNRIDD